MNEKKRVHLCLAHMSEEGWEQKYIQEAFDTNWVTPLGPNVTAFETMLESFVGEGKRVVALSSGTAAIHLALVSLGVGQGDEVICQSFTFVASCNPILYQGATPILVDSEKDSWNMDPDLLEKAIRDRIAKRGRAPKAMVLVCLYGMPAQYDRLLEIARRYGVAVVEDASEAMGSRYEGRQCGTFGDFGVFSFNGNKMITTSGGGALICPDDQTYEKALFYATQAREPFSYYQHEEVGYNYRMSNICAGIGRGQMHVLQSHIDRHRAIKRAYETGLSGLKGISFHGNPNHLFDSNFWLTAIVLSPELTVECDDVRLSLDQIGVEARHLWKPLHLQPLFKEVPMYLNGVSDDLFARGLCLPSGPMVSDEDVRMIVEHIRSIVG